MTIKITIVGTDYVGLSKVDAMLNRKESRFLTDVVEARGASGKIGSADVALSYIGKLYALEKEALGKTFTFDEIHLMCQERAKPILEEFYAWLSKKFLQTPPKGLLGKAVSYALNQWQKLIGYLEDGRLAPDNNMAKNCIRPFVIGRKNWPFSGTPAGAEASALLYSLIETAKANNLEPYAYLRYIFDKLPLASVLEGYEALLPWNVTPEKMGLVSLARCG